MIDKSNTLRVLAAVLILGLTTALPADAQRSPGADFEPIEHVGEACLIAVMLPMSRALKARREPTRMTVEDALRVKAHCRCGDVQKVVREAPPEMAFDLWDAVREMACSK